MKNKYLIVKCLPLDVQFECDADRTPICLTDNYTDFLEYGYEIYELQDDNSFELIYDYSMWEK